MDKIFSEPDNLIDARLDVEIVEDDCPQQSTWHKPTVSYIDIRRTLNGSGSVTDGSFAFTPI